ncbi:hypothetical protein DFO69_0479 [Bacillus subtilis]|nr:hypothetical protein DFO69_0479 [Bacillus subtilis]
MKELIGVSGKLFLMKKLMCKKYIQKPKYIRIGIKKESL